MRRALTVIAAALLGISFAQGTGRLALEPASGTVGTTVVGAATGLEPGLEVELVWMSADASWNVGEGTFHGVVAEETRSVVGTGTVGEDGSVEFEFVVPDDYGYVHNVFVESGGEQVARQGFTVAPSLSISPTSGPVGTPITVTMKGVGYRFWESVWHLLYDGAHTGWVSAITTNGTAVFTLPAVVCAVAAPGGAARSWRRGRPTRRLPSGRGGLCGGGPIRRVGTWRRRCDPIR